jgi:GNAT superfamily N-acetyltransferase
MSGADLTIRRAVPGDARSIAEVHTTCWHVAYRGLVPEDVLARVTVERHGEEWAQYLGRNQPPAERVWVASRRGQVLGFAYTAPSRDPDCDTERVAELVALYVEPGHWRHGLGRGLTRACLDDLRERGYDELTLWVLGANRRARRFYQALGFRTDGTTEQRTFGGAKLPLVRYRLGLGSAPG